MYRKILVPLDGSKLAESALPFALSLAERSGGELHLIRVVTMVPPYAPFEDSGVGNDRWLEDFRTASSKYLQEIRERIRQAGSDIASQAHVLSGRPVRAIHRHILEKSIDQVVMTTHGRGRLQRMWLGSVADGVVRSVPAPVFLWRGDEEGGVDLTARPSHRRILVPLDGSEMARAILPWAEELARLFEAQLFLVGVIPQEVGFDSPYIPHAAEEEAKRDSQRDELEAHLARAAEGIGRRGMEVSHGVVSAPSAHDGIMSEQERIGADVVALSTRGRDPGTRLLLGSVADKVIRGSEVHVLVHRDTEEN